MSVTCFHIFFWSQSLGEVKQINNRASCIWDELCFSLFTRWSFHTIVVTTFLISVDQECLHFFSLQLLLKWPGQKDHPVLKYVNCMYFYICTKYILYIDYMFKYLASLHEPLQHNSIEYIYGHYLILMTWLEWNQLELHSLDCNCW